MVSTPQPIIPSRRTLAVIDAAGETSVGQRRPKNEDQYLIATIQRQLCIDQSSVAFGDHWVRAHVDGKVIAVADGMGGTADGDVASSIAIRSVVDYLSMVMPWLDGGDAELSRRSLPGVRHGLSDVMAQSDRAVKVAAAQGVGKGTMGTTLTIAYIHYPMLYVAHVGDSRCYLWRKGNLSLLTRDHTVAQQVREQGGEVAPGSRWSHVLWNALTGSRTTHAQPEIQRFDLELGDVILLCSDGLTKHVADEQIAEVLAGGDSAAGVAKRLVAAANAAGGSDNITVALATLGGG